MVKNENMHILCSGGDFVAVFSMIVVFLLQVTPQWWDSSALLCATAMAP